MCGIAGIYGNPDTEALRRMIEIMHHRGPDDKGLCFDETCGLGHARLSIVDLSEAGRQPMLNEDGAVMMIVNGEVYNHKELREQLEKHGHVFRSRSDSETIIHAYEQWGAPEFLNQLRGMFALAIYDQKTCKLILARDPIGKKPLYYWWSPNSPKRLAFASEIKALFPLGVPKAVNHNAVFGYLMYGYSVGRETLFESVRKVLGGEYLTFDGTVPRIEKYWDIEWGKHGVVSQHATPELVASQVMWHIRVSAKLRMQADVPVGSFLSGGIDSAAVTALCAQYCAGDFHTFSVGFPMFSELPYARLVSQHLGTQHHEIIVTPEMAARDLDTVAWHFDEPVGDAATFCNYYLAREARTAGIKVVVAGEGGDELFGGYQHYKVGKMLGWWFDGIPFHVPVPRFATGTLRRLWEFSDQWSLGHAHAYMLQTIPELELQRMARVPVGGRVLGPNPYPPMPDPITEMMARDCKNLLPEKFLMKADKGTMAWGVEERCPLLDKEVIELAFSIPLKWKLRGGTTKWVLRKAAEDLLPKEIVWRKKQGFGTPVLEWLRYPPIRERVVDCFSNGGLVKEIFRQDALDRMVKELRDDSMPKTGLGAHFWTNKVWTIFMLQVWHIIYLSSRDNHHYLCAE